MNQFVMSLKLIKNLFPIKMNNHEVYKLLQIIRSLEGQYDYGGDEDDDGGLIPGQPDFDKAREEIKKLSTEDITKTTIEQRNFRWMYKALITLAKRILQDENNNRQYLQDFPCGMTWDELSTLAKKGLINQAMEESQISDEEKEEILGGIKTKKYYVSHLLENAK